jgi:hypothetical protein
MKRLFAGLCIAVAAICGSTIGGTHGTALAANDVTGTANACAKHAANKGNSYAYDLNCGVATLTFSAIPNGNGTFTLTVAGSGLLPGSTVNLVNVGTGIPTPLGTVASNGTFSWSNVSEPCSQSPMDVYVTATAANGTSFYAPDLTTPPANCT